MKNPRLNWILSILLILLLTAGCAGSPADTATAPAGETAVASPVAEVAATTPMPVVDSNILYQDDFTNPASGWPEEKFDNYFIGYHEPEYYHIEITSPNYKTTVFEPEKKSFGDASIETKVFTNSKQTFGNRRFYLWRGFPPFGRSILCLYDFPTLQNMVCA